MLKKYQRFAVLIYVLLSYGFVVGISVVAGLPIIFAGILMAVGGFVSGYYSPKMLEWCLRGA